MRRHRRMLAGVAIVLIAVAAFLPRLTGLDWILVERPWTRLPAPAPLIASVAVVEPDDQPLARRTLLPPRAPPIPTA